MDDIRFSDDEVREILEQALQTSSSGALARGDGVSLEDLRVIGEEIGVSTTRMEEAAVAVARKRERRPNWLLGAPTVLNFERTVVGELPADSVPDILSVIRRATGRQGEANEVGGALEWNAKSEPIDRHLAVSTRGGRTTIRASANLSGLALMTYVPAAFVGGIGSIIGFMQAANAGIAVGMIFFVSVVPVLYLLLRTILGRMAASEGARLQQAVDELARLAETESGSGGPEP